MIVVRLPKDLEERLIRLSTETGKTKAWHVREAITGYLAELEDVRLAQKVLERVRAGKEDTVHLDDMIARFDAEN